MRRNEKNTNKIHYSISIKRIFSNYIGWKVDIDKCCTLE